MNRAEIMRLIPHAGAMCLLDEVLDWDGDALRARHAATPDNPLRRADGTLGAACGIEIASQAMALHGRLASGAEGAPVPGMLVSLREVRLHGAALPALPLDIAVHRLLGDARGASYDFSVAAAGTTLLEGRAMVVFG